MHAGFGELVGTDTATIIARTTALLTDDTLYARRTSGVNPFGDGKAAMRITDVVESVLCNAPVRTGPRRLDHAAVNETLERLARAS